MILKSLFQLLFEDKEANRKAILEFEDSVYKRVVLVSIGKPPSFYEKQGLDTIREILEEYKKLIKNPEIKISFDRKTKTHMTKVKISFDEINVSKRLRACGFVNRIILIKEYRPGTYRKQ